MKLFAVFETLTAGYPVEQDRLKSLHFKVGDKFEVDRIEVGGWSTYVFIKDYKHGINSVFFRFVNSDDAEFDIFKEPHYLVNNMYI